LEVDRDVEWQTCKRCQHRVNVAAQVAYHRGRTHFESIADEIADALEQEIEHTLSPRKAKRRQPDPPKISSDTRQTYQQAYAALQIALQHTLPEAQRAESIRMLAKLSNILAGRGMIGSTEHHFWASLLRQTQQRQEHQEIQAMLDELDTVPFSLGRVLKRFSLRLHQRRRVRALRSLAEELDWYARMGLRCPPRADDADTQEP
jgi:hypothetical protein